jgi:hypothetical protein
MGTGYSSGFVLGIAKRDGGLPKLFMYSPAIHGNCSQGVLLGQTLGEKMRKTVEEEVNSRH